MKRIMLMAAATFMLAAGAAQAKNHYDSDGNLWSDDGRWLGDRNGVFSDQRAAQVRAELAAAKAKAKAKADLVAFDQAKAAKAAKPTIAQAKPANTAPALGASPVC